jgi:hypothetical protein
MLGISQENILLGAEVTRKVYVKFSEDSFNYQLRSRNINTRTCKSDTRIYMVNGKPPQLEEGTRRVWSVDQQVHASSTMKTLGMKSYLEPLESKTYLAR